MLNILQQFYIISKSNDYTRIASSSFSTCSGVCEHGLNVHANDRDERVGAAMELLLQHQGEMLRNTINQAVEDFIQYHQ
jgi:hypothetical protein